MAESNNISEGPKIAESTNRKKIDSLPSSDENSTSYTDSESESESQSESVESESECPADTRETTIKRLYSEEVDIVNLAVSNNVERSNDSSYAAASNFQYAKNNDSESKLPPATQENDSPAQQNKTNKRKKEPITHGLSPDVGPETGACASSRLPGDLGKAGPSHVAEHVLRGKHCQNPQYNSPPPLTTDTIESHMRKATPESELSTVLPESLHGGAKPKGRRGEPSGRKKRKRKERKPPNDAGQEPSGKEGAAQPSRTKNHQSMGEPDYQQSTQLWSDDPARTLQKQRQLYSASSMGLPSTPEPEMLASDSGRKESFLGLQLSAKSGDCDTVSTEMLEVTHTSAKMKTVPLYLDLIETDMKNDEATDMSDSGLESLDGNSPQTPTTTAAVMRDRGAAVKTDTTSRGTTDFAAVMYTAAANTATAYVADTVANTPTTTAEAIAAAGPISDGSDGATSAVSSGECDIQVAADRLVSSCEVFVKRTEMAETSSFKQGLKDSTDEKEIDDCSFSSSLSDSESEYPADTRGTISKQLYLNEVIDNLVVSNDIENSDLSGATANHFQHAKDDSDNNSDSVSKLSSATQEVKSTAQQNRTNEHDKEPITSAHVQPLNVGSEAGECASSRPQVDVGKTGSSHLAERIVSEKDDQSSQYVRSSRPIGPAVTVAFVSSAALNPAFDVPPVLQDPCGGARPKQRREEHSRREKRNRRRRKPPVPKDSGPELSDAEGGAQAQHTQCAKGGARVNGGRRRPDGLSALGRAPLVENRHGTMMHQSHGRESDFKKTSESRSTANVSAIITNSPATGAETVTVHGDVADASASDSATSGEFSGDCDNPHQVMRCECLSSATSLSPPATSPRTADVAGKALLPSSPPSLSPSSPAPATSAAVLSITSPPVSTPWTMPITTTTITATHLMSPTTATTKATITATTTTTTASSTSAAATRVLYASMGLRLSPQIAVIADAPRSQSPVPRRFQSDQLGHHIRLLRPTLGQEVYPRGAAAYDVDLAWPNAAGFPAAAHLRIILGASNFQCRTNTDNGNRQQGMAEGQRQTIRNPSQELWHEVLQNCDLPRGIHGQLCETCRRRPAVLLVFGCHHELCEPCCLRRPDYCMACGEFIIGLSPFL